MHLNLAKTVRILSTLLALSLVVACAVHPAQAQTFTSLYSFQGPDSDDGSYPNGLVQATHEYLYGTTGAGGGGVGTVFRISTTGVETPLYSFDTQGGDPDGEGNSAALVQAANGNFYGTTEGNSGGCSGPNGTCGVFYKITPSGTFTILYDFCSASNNVFCSDGTTTEAALVQASNGDFYGTNQVYGAYNEGTIFKLTLSGVLTTLHSFCALQQYEDCPDGAPPFSALVQGTDGNLYGTTVYGGANFFDGTAFKITPGGTFTTLHSFGTNGDLGEYPTGGLIQAANGNFYGTTSGGGSTGYGSFFTMTPSGAVTTLYSFCATGDCPDGNDPGGLFLATDGNFYGLTTAGGANNAGTIFQLTPSGALTTLHNFDLADGFGGGTITQDTSGILYGTTIDGGINYQTTCSCGTVFSLQMGLAPFVETLPTSGKVGAAVKILGSNLTGATSVTFDGTPATFTVKSKSEITTTVPAGATTGLVSVTVGAHTLASAQTFRVTP